MLESYRPRLHAGIYPRIKPGKGELTYLYQDDLGARYHEFEPEQHQVITLIDGTRSLNEIAEEASRLLDAEIPPEFIEVFVSNLEKASLLSLGSCRSVSPAQQQRLVAHLRKQLQKRFYTLEEWAAPAADSAEIDELMFQEAMARLVQGEACEGARLLEGLLELSPSHRRAKFVLGTLEKHHIAPLTEGDSIWFFRIPLGDPDRLLGFLNRTFGKVIFTPAFAVIWLCVVASGLAITVTEFDRLFAGIEQFASFDWMLKEPWLFLVVLGIARAMLVTHEFAHGLTCKHYGGPVRRMGLLFAYFNPGAYCDVTSLYLCEKKWQRALVGLAGVSSDLFFASLMAWVFFLFREDALLARAAPPILMVTFFGFFNNLNPILRNDGSIVFTELIGNSSFRTEAFDYITRRARAFFEGSQMHQRQHFREAVEETVRLTVLRAKVPESEGLICEAQSIDVSAGGMQLASILALMPDDRVRLEFNLSIGGQSRMVDIDGRVTRCLPLDGDRFATGVQFSHAIAVEALEGDARYRRQYLAFGLLGGGFNVFMIGMSLWFMTHLALTQWGAFGILFVVFLWTNLLGTRLWGAGRYIWKHRRDLWASPRSRRLLLAGGLLTLSFFSLPAKRMVEGTCELVYSEHVVRMPWTSRVMEVLVRPGQEVFRGQPLMRLDDTALKAESAQKSAELAQARLALNLLEQGPRREQVEIEESKVEAARVRKAFDVWRRARMMSLPEGVAREVDLYRVETDLASYSQALDDSQAALGILLAKPREEQAFILAQRIQTLETELARLQERLDKATVVAPEDGRLAEWSEPHSTDGYGLTLAEGAELLRIRRPGYPMLRARFPGQQRLEALERGLLTEARLYGAPDEEITGTVKALSIAAQEAVALPSRKGAPAPTNSQAPRDVVALIELSQGMEIGNWPAGLSGRVRIDAGWVPRVALIYETLSQSVRDAYRRLTA